MKKIPLTKGKYAIVDDEDFEFISRLNLSYVNRVLMARFENRKSHIDIPVSHLIMGKKVKGYLAVVPKNLNPLDLRKENLFMANGSHFIHSISQNYRNTPKTSKYRGVCFGKKSGKWKASIQKNGVRYQNTFSTEKKAGQFYNKKAKELYGKHAYQNKI